MTMAPRSSMVQGIVPYPKPDLDEELLQVLCELISSRLLRGGHRFPGLKRLARAPDVVQRDSAPVTNDYDPR